MPELTPIEHSPVPVPERLRFTPGITITHHLPDAEFPWLSISDQAGFEQTCHQLKDQGVSSQRFDIRWERVAPTVNTLDETYLHRAKRIADIGTKTELSNIIILSSPPSWALELAKHDHEGFRKAYSTYVDTVFATLADQQSAIPLGIQIFNELNMRNFTPESLLPHIPVCTQIVREKSAQYFGTKIPLVATLQASQIGGATSIPGMMEGIRTFIAKRTNILELFDHINLDYYPGIWHQPTKSLGRQFRHLDYFVKVLRNRNNPDAIKQLHTPLDVFRSFREMDLLEQSLTDLKPLANRGITLGIGEIGVPSVKPFETNAMKGEHEKLQEVGLRIILGKLRPIIQRHGLTSLGVYSLMDEHQREVGLFNWGLYDKNGRPRKAAGVLSMLLKKTEGVFYGASNATPAPPERVS